MCKTKESSGEEEVMEDRYREHEPESLECLRMRDLSMDDRSVVSGYDPVFCYARW